MQHDNTTDKTELLEEVFSSRGRTRVLIIVASEMELNISEIVRRARLNFTNVRKHLEFFKSIGLVDEKRFGRIKIYRFNDTNPLGKAIKSLIDIVED